MLSGVYNYLADNMWLCDIISVVLLIIPFFLIFFKSSYLISYYIISIVANLPLVFFMTFNFTYEAIVILCILVVLIKELIINRTVTIVYSKDNIKVIYSLLLVLIINVVFSLFNLNLSELITRVIQYVTNVFILVLLSYYFIKKPQLMIVKRAFLIGSVIIIVSMIVELIYGYYYFGVRNLRPAGLLLDPNVAGFALNVCLIISFYRDETDKKTVGLLNYFTSSLLIISLRVMIIFGIFLTVSRSSYIGTVIILVYFLVYYSKKTYKFVVPTVVITLLVMYLVFFNTVNTFIKDIFQIIDLDRVFVPGVETPSEIPGGTPSDEVSNTDSRLMIAIASVKVFFNNFALGVGIGNVRNNINLYSNMNTNSHNLILQLLVESGFLMIVLLLILGYYIINLIKKARGYTKVYLALIFLIVIVESFFNHNLLNINLTFVLLAFSLRLSTFNTKNRLVKNFER